MTQLAPVDSGLAALRGELPDCVYNTEAIAKWQGRFGGASLLAEERNR